MIGIRIGLRPMSVLPRKCQGVEIQVGRRSNDQNSSAGRNVELILRTASNIDRLMSQETVPGPFRVAPDHGLITQRELLNTCARTLILPPRGERETPALRGLQNIDSEMEVPARRRAWKFRPQYVYTHKQAVNPTRPDKYISGPRRT